MAKKDSAGIIDAIIKEIEFGKERGNVLAIIGKRWGISIRTFDRYWKTAHQKHKESSKEFKERVLQATVDAVVEGRKYEILTAFEKKEILSKVIAGKKKFTDIQLRALNELNRMEGDHSTGKKSDHVEQPVFPD